MEQAMLNLFYGTLPKFLEGKITPRFQPQESGTFHSAAELKELKNLDLDETMTVGRVIDILRACTFPPYPGARFVVDDVEYDIKVQIEKINL